MRVCGLIKATGEKLPYADASFDAVTIQGVLHHLPDVHPLLREAARVLRPGGELYISEPCREGALAGRLARMAGRPLGWLISMARGRSNAPMVSDHEEPVSGAAARDRDP